MIHATLVLLCDNSSTPETHIALVHCLRFALSPLRITTWTARIRLLR